MKVLNQPIDIREYFYGLDTQYFIADKVLDFDIDRCTGTILFKRFARKARIAFNDVSLPFEESASWEFPPDYSQDLEVRLKVELLSDRVFRILMYPGELSERNVAIEHRDYNLKKWNGRQNSDAIEYCSGKLDILIQKDPFNIVISEKGGRVLFGTNNMRDRKCLHNIDPIPFCIGRRIEDTNMYFAGSLSLHAGEMIFGGGESFTSLNKRGQKLVLYTKDPHGVQTEYMYKPVPFLMSSRGYGLFYNTTAPLTFDIGYGNNLANVAYLGEDVLDLFVFTGKPKDILRDYTELSGRSPMPPLWSFGLWMSRASYNNQQEIREVTKKLRKLKIPCDVIHIDTNWFEHNWRCDYEFSRTDFKDPEKMISDLKDDGFRVSLWQYPYFTPNNRLYREILEKGYAVKGYGGHSPVPDAVLDFSNPEAVEWYKEKLKELFRMGVSAIKADFGEAAPVNGLYASGKTGFYEHNAYPYRYNKAVAEATREAGGENIIWARSAWAGSQKFPVHWGGDSDSTSCGMAASLRGGLSLGLCGFSFWSHDIGGIVSKPTKDLYRRWLAFGMLSSHSRCHGTPKEPWVYDEEFIDVFRKAVELKYTLMPYIIEQSQKCCANGFPLLRTLFFEFPEDKGSWFIDDEYILGENILVAPVFEENEYAREVYLPCGEWVDYVTGQTYDGGKWRRISGSEYGAVIVARAKSAIPHLPVCQCTRDMDFSKVYFKKF